MGLTDYPAAAQALRVAPLLLAKVMRAVQRHRVLPNQPLHRRRPQPSRHLPPLWSQNLPSLLWQNPPHRLRHRFLPPLWQNPLHRFQLLLPLWQKPPQWATGKWPTPPT